VNRTAESRASGRLSLARAIGRLVLVVGQR
jgi:hypothetical protein